MSLDFAFLVLQLETPWLISLTISGSCSGFHPAFTFCLRRRSYGSEPGGGVRKPLNREDIKIRNYSVTLPSTPSCRLCTAKCGIHCTDDFAPVMTRDEHDYAQDEKSKIISLVNIYWNVKHSILRHHWTQYGDYTFKWFFLGGNILFRNTTACIE